MTHDLRNLRPTVSGVAAVVAAGEAKGRLDSPSSDKKSRHVSLLFSPLLSAAVGVESFRRFNSFLKKII